MGGLLPIIARHRPAARRALTSIRSTTRWSTASARSHSSAYPTPMCSAWRWASMPTPSTPVRALGRPGAQRWRGLLRMRAVPGSRWGRLRPLLRRASMTDRYVAVLQPGLQGLAGRVPRQLAVLLRLPRVHAPTGEAVKPDPRIVPALAVIGLSPLTARKPRLPEKSYWIWLAREWRKLLPEVYDGYNPWPTLASPSRWSAACAGDTLGRRLGIKGGASRPSAIGQARRRGCTWPPS